MPVLAGILLQGGGDTITLTGSKLESAMRVGLGAEIEGEVQPIVLPGRKLIDVCGKLEPDGKVVLERKDTVVKLKYKRSVFTLRTHEPDQFPTFPEKPDTDMSIPAETLKDVFDKTIIAVATEKSRPMICGVYLKCDGKTLTAVATDSKFMVWATAPHDHDFEGIIVPSESVRNIARVFTAGDMWLSVSNNQLICGQADKTVSSLLIEAEYVAYKTYLDLVVKYEASFECDREELLGAVENACLLSDALHSQIVLSGGGDTLIVESDLVNVGGSHNQVAANFQGTMERTGLNGTYIRKVLTSLDCERVEIGHGNPVEPISLFPVGSDDYKCVIVPMRL
jgi:DNA polymerase-3 subunit beta